MKINKDALKALAGLGDKELWSALRAMAQEHGYTLPETAPRPEDMAKIRAALGGAEKISLSDAAKILNGYKRKG